MRKSNLVIYISFELTKRLLHRLYGLFFIVSIFLVTGCTSPKTSTISTSLSMEERKDLEYFLRDLMFDNQGCFVLFGSKPLCELGLHNTDITEDPAFDDWFAALSEEERTRIEAALSRAKPVPPLARNPYNGWLALQKIKEKLPMKNYLFRAVPTRGRGGYDLMLVNIAQTALVLAEHYEIFKQAAGGIDFHPLQAVFALQDPDSVFWKNVFSMENHLAKGLLFGFGLRNSLLGHWSFSLANGNLCLPVEEHKEEVESYLTTKPSQVSTTLFSASASGLAIPRFGAVPGDEVAEKYAKEREAIEKIYRGRDMVEVTLERLFSR